MTKAKFAKIQQMTKATTSNRTWTLTDEGWGCFGGCSGCNGWFLAWKNGRGRVVHSKKWAEDGRVRQHHRAASQASEQEA